MTAVAISGNHPRHTYMVKKLAAAGLIAGWVREIREDFVPAAPAALNEEDRFLISILSAESRQKN